MVGKFTLTLLLIFPEQPFETNYGIIEGYVE